jgi:hypothetical protein
MTPPLPATLIDKVAGVAVDCHDVEDLAPGLERLLGVELTEAELAYVTELGRRVLVAVLEARPR